MLGLLLSCCYGNWLQAQAYDLLKKTVASDKGWMNYFGSDVAICGNYAVIGADHYDYMPSYSSMAGAAYIFQYTGGTWIEKQKILASDKGYGDRFGHAVDISDSVIVIGVPYEDNDVLGNDSMVSAGAVYVFEFNGSTWYETQKLVASDRDTSDLFGYSVAVSGNTIVIGALNKKLDSAGVKVGDRAGVVYVFEYNGFDWVEKQKLVASDAQIYDEFGTSVAISDSLIVVGAAEEDNRIYALSNRIGKGSAYIFERQGGIWMEIQKIYPTGNRNDNDDFGQSVDISDSIIIVGAPGEDTSTTNIFYGAGAAYVFEHNGNSWGQSQKLVALDRGPRDIFGYSIAISDSTIIVGAPHESHDTSGLNSLFSSGSAYVFQKQGNNWNQVQKLIASDRRQGDWYGFSVAASDQHIAIGAIYSDSIDPATGYYIAGDMGAAYFYRRNCHINSSVNIVACDAYTVPSGDETYMVSGIYVDTIPSVEYCDSIITINLTINQSNADTTTIVTCDPYTWVDGMTYTASNNTASFIYTNVVGCDSVVYLDLTINSTTGTDVISSCDPYTWIDGITYITSNNSATDTLTNSVGCDSVVTLDLTINTDHVTDVITTCDSLNWINGITYTASNNTATDTLTNIHGCDSIVTLDLTVNYSSVTVDSVVNCNPPYTWINGRNYYNSNNTATHLLTSSSGCDSLIKLDLTIPVINLLVLKFGINSLSCLESGADSYQWLDCDNDYVPINGATNRGFNPSFNGSYAAAITVNGCTDTTSCYSVTGIGIIESQFLGLSLYPNPAEGKVTVELGKYYGSVTAEIFNTAGQVVRSENFYNTNELELFIDDFPPGVYWLQLSADKSRAFLKVVKN